MEELYYSIVGLIAIATYFFVNKGIYHFKREDRGSMMYLRYQNCVLLYFVVDTLWGLTSMLDSPTLLYVNTMAYYISMALSVVYCCRYVTSYLSLENVWGKALNTFGAVFAVAEMLVLVVNIFWPIFFWVDDTGNYHANIVRHIALITQILMFAIMSIISFCTINKREGVQRDRQITISSFAAVMTIALLAQTIFPMLPLYTIGLMMGILVVHFFIHAEEQGRRMDEMANLNKELMLARKIVRSSGMGMWRLIMEEGKQPELRGDKTMLELMGISEDSKMTGVEINNMLLDRINKEDMEAFMQYHNDLMEGKRSEVTYRWNHPTFGERYFRCGGVATMIDGVKMTCGYHYDVTEQILTDIQRNRQLEESIAANKAKTKFLQNMSHEIRTPLNALFGFAQLLGLPDGSWTQEEKDTYNSYILNSYNMLEMLVSDVIDLADMQHNNYRIELGEVHVNTVCKNAIMSVEFRCPAAVKMYNTSDLSDDFTITSDARRIQQVLINYLTNACKNTTKGEIHLHCTDKAKEGYITFSVTDTGRGVPPEKAEAIFGRFTKLNQFVQGSGLGLNICTAIAEKLEGAVYLDKTYTNGARFIFEVKNAKK